ncbi:MAG: 50S ribosomal protein L11 methyltransferase, partial [Acidobacteriota bacterium]
MYSLPDYGRMLGEPTRFGAYRRALERAVTGGEIVMDIGAGPGVLGLLAAQAGASRVYAVEPDPVVELAAKLARSNDLPQLEVVPQLSSTFSPENRADVLISDLRGVLPTFTEHLASIIDARDRLLKPGGTLIPRRDVLMACPVCAPEARRRHLGGFEVEGLDLEIARRRASHLWTRVELEKRAVASEPVQIAELDYRTITDPNVKGQASFELDGRPLDGIAVWFDADIDGEERFSNAPSSSLIYGQAFFPFDSSLETRAGDVLHLGFAAHYVAGDDYLYRWRG